MNKKEIPMIIKQSNNNKPSVKMSQSDWREIGKQAGWLSDFSQLFFNLKSKKEPKTIQELNSLLKDLEILHESTEKKIENLEKSVTTQFDTVHKQRVSK